MNKPKEESDLDVLSIDLSSILRINDSLKDNATPKAAQEIDKCEIDCITESASTNIEQHETKQENITCDDDSHTYNDNYKGATKSVENAELNMDESPAQFKTVGKIKEREKNMSRKKMKEYNIISKRNAIARPPSYFKFDKSTTTLLDLLIQYRLVGEYHSVIGKGVKSVVIHANCRGKYHSYFPCGNAVKVYNFSKDEEKNKAVCKMVQREVDVLYTLSTKHSGNNFPHPVYHTRNIILMSFIGSDQETAPSVTTAPSENSQELYHFVVKEMDMWYNKLNFVHGNLSAKTILYWFDKLYFIGWSHFVLKDHPKALAKLMRDCQFVTKFFEDRGVPVKPTEQLFKDITGLDDISSKVLEVIHAKNLWHDHNKPNPNRKNNIASKPSRISRFK